MRKTRRELIVGDKVDLMCLAYGKPTPNVTWYKDGKIYERSHDGYKLVFKELDIVDSGLYMCNVSNAFGFLTYTYKLTVKG